MSKRHVYIQCIDILGRNFGTNIELALKHKEAGDEVHLIICRGDLPACPPNSRHDKLACKLCRSKLDRALNLPELREIKVHEIKLSNSHLEFPIKSFETAEELKKFSLDDINHGLEAASSVFTLLKDPRPDLSKEQKLVRANLISSVALYRWTKAFFKNRSIDRLYVLNGRYSSQMPAVRAARYYAIPITTFEVAHDRFKYVLVDGTYFHDIEEKKREIEVLWQKAELSSNREEIGHRFFKDRRFGADKQFPETKYKKRQVPGCIPDNFHEKERNIVIYNSSEDEFEAVTGYENPVYVNQMIGLKNILNDDRLSKEIKIWLRVHPHLANRKNSQTEAIAKLRHPQLHIIDPTEPIDSYAIMEMAEKVLTFGSTMSVESAYAGVPSILVGREAYEDLGCCYKPGTHDEVIELINTTDLEPLSQEGALKFGYWSIAREHDYQYFNPQTQSIGKVRIRPNLCLYLFANFWWSRYGHKIRSIFGLNL